MNATDDSYNDLATGDEVILRINGVDQNALVIAVCGEYVLDLVVAGPAPDATTTYHRVYHQSVVTDLASWASWRRPDEPARMS